MARPLRLEFPGSLWHVTSRGNEQRDIFRDDEDRELFLHLLGKCVKRFDWILTAYVLMSNHFHLVIQLTVESLSRGLQWFNGEYARRFNERHERAGHLYQGRPDCRLIQKEAYGLNVLRYTILNPVRAHMVARPEQYPWSSHRAVIGEAPTPKWLAVDDVLIQFAPNREMARGLYRDFVGAGIGIVDSPWKDLVGQMFLGTQEWMEEVRQRVDLKPRAAEHPRAQRLVGKQSMSQIIAAVAKTLSIDEDRVRRDRTGRCVAGWIGRHEALLTNREIAAGFRLDSDGYVSRLLQQSERTVDAEEGVRLWIDECVSTLRGAQAKSKA